MASLFAFQPPPSGSLFDAARHYLVVIEGVHTLASPRPGMPISITSLRADLDAIIAWCHPAPLLGKASRGLFAASSKRINGDVRALGQYELVDGDGPHDRVTVLLPTGASVDGGDAEQRSSMAILRANAMRDEMVTIAGASAPWRVHFLKDAGFKGVETYEGAVEALRAGSEIEGYALSVVVLRYIGPNAAVLAKWLSLSSLH